MNLIKVHTAKSTSFGYELGNPIIINLDYISSIFLLQKNNLLSSAMQAEKRTLETHFDMDLSKLCILKITLLPHESFIIFAPYEKFENFNNK